MPDTALVLRRLHHLRLRARAGQDRIAAIDFVAGGPRPLQPRAGRPDPPGLLLGTELTRPACAPTPPSSSSTASRSRGRPATLGRRRGSPRRAVRCRPHDRAPRRRTAGSTAPRDPGVLGDLVQQGAAGHQVVGVLRQLARAHVQLAHGEVLGGTRSRSAVLMSTAVTLPEGPTAAYSHSVMLPLPPPSSGHRQPCPSPSPARYPRVQGSRILHIRSSRWYSNVAASSRMYGRIGLTASRKPARRPTVADNRRHALPVGPFGPGVPGRVPLSPGADPGHPGGEPGNDAEEPMMRVLVTAATKYGATAEIA